MTRRRIVGWLAASGAAGAALVGWPGSETRVHTSAAPVVSNPAPAASLQRDERFAALPARESMGTARGDLFGARVWTPKAAQPPAASAQALAAVPAAPQPPPLPYRFAGQVVHDGAARVVLARDDRVLTVREGEMLDDDYRVESIGPDQITLLYLPLGTKEVVPVTSALGLQAPPPIGAARPAQVRWEGPERVHAGNPFNVALKVTSAQAVRASPLQLQFDADLLEAVAVRPGGFFKNGSFNYRVDPGGSILVGAIGKGGIAADDEFLVVTFRPIRPGETAELTLSSLALQGAAGGVIAHDPPAVFRTAIVQ